jgi:hypothetical protein
VHNLLPLTQYYFVTVKETRRNIFAQKYLVDSFFRKNMNY